MKLVDKCVGDWATYFSACLGCFILTAVVTRWVYRWPGDCVCEQETVSVTRILCLWPGPTTCDQVVPSQCRIGWNWKLSNIFLKSLGITTCKRWPEIRFLWLKLPCATFIFQKYFNFISKKVALEARFLCSGVSGRLKHALFYSKLKFFSIKVESNLLYRTRIARKFL